MLSGEGVSFPPLGHESETAPSDLMNCRGSATINSQSDTSCLVSPSVCLSVSHSHACLSPDMDAQTQTPTDNEAGKYKYIRSWER